MADITKTGKDITTSDGRTISSQLHDEDGKALIAVLSILYQERSKHYAPGCMYINEFGSNSDRLGHADVHCTAVDDILGIGCKNECTDISFDVKRVNDENAKSGKYSLNDTLKRHCLKDDGSYLQHHYTAFRLYDDGKITDRFLIVHSALLFDKVKPVAHVDKKDSSGKDSSYGLYSIEDIKQTLGKDFYLEIGLD